MKTQFISAFWATTFLTTTAFAAGSATTQAAPTTDEKILTVLNEIQAVGLCQEVVIKTECFEPNSCAELLRQKNEALYRLRARTKAQIPPLKKSFERVPERSNVMFERDEDFECAQAIARLMSVSARGGPQDVSYVIPVFKRALGARNPRPVLYYTWSNPGVAF